MIDIVELRRRLKEQYGDQFELEVAAENTPVLTIIDASFDKLPRDQRVAKVQSLLEEAGLRGGILELYSPEEAVERGISITPPSPQPAPATWEQAVSLVESGQTLHRSSLRKPRRIVFYSYKGGVGRTTAIVHTAFHLARARLRVALVDMDVEAPGLHTVLPHPGNKPITVGLVDYLWERQVRPFNPETGEGLETCLVEGVAPGRTAISYAVEDPVSRTQIQVIPAGCVGTDFVRRLSTLSSQEVLTR
ncbi:MAG TPA: P-loop NTPase, partial [Archangium sp.]|nr:P-loop NTPase [Archangium sp.]